MHCICYIWICTHCTLHSIIIIIFFRERKNGKKRHPIFGYDEFIVIANWKSICNASSTKWLSEFNAFNGFAGLNWKWVVRMSYEHEHIFLCMLLHVSQSTFRLSFNDNNDNTEWTNIWFNIFHHFEFSILKCTFNVQPNDQTNKKAIQFCNRPK